MAKNRRLRELYFDVPMTVFCLVAVWACWRYLDTFDETLFSVLIAPLIFIFIYRIYKTILGEDMSTEAVLEDIEKRLQERQEQEA